MKSSDRLLSEKRSRQEPSSLDAPSAAVAGAERVAGEAHAVQVEVLVRPADAAHRAVADEVAVLLCGQADTTGAGVQQRAVSCRRPGR